MSETNRCPECGAELPASAPRGLCPACLLKRGLESNTAGYTAEGSPSSRWAVPGVDELAPRFPELEITRLIGRGGMGAVYQARQKNLDRVVALKILPSEMANDPAFAERFAREAQAMARLNHPHITAIHEFGQRGGWFYFIMEYVDGVSLRGLLDSGHVSPKEALAIVPQICDALQYAHDQGIVHRDIKPENILLNKNGQVKIADFGLAKLMGQSPFPLGEGGRYPGRVRGPSDEPTGPNASPVSDKKIMGTPQYMAPEQLSKPGEVDHRADIYSLGVVFYQMLTGEMPKGKLEAPSRKVVIDVRLDAVVLRALEREPERRYQQVSEIKTELETIAITREQIGAGEQDLSQLQSPPKRKSILAEIPLIIASLSAALAVWYAFVGAYAQAGIFFAFPISLGAWLIVRKRKPELFESVRKSSHFLLGVIFALMAIQGSTGPQKNSPLLIIPVGASLFFFVLWERGLRAGSKPPNGQKPPHPPNVPPSTNQQTTAYRPPASSPPSTRGLLLCFGLLYTVFIIFLFFTREMLPIRIASHFDGEGVANGWMSRDADLIFFAILPLVIAAVFWGVARLTRTIPAEYIRIPNRDYWLSPEHREEAGLIMERHMLALACLMTLFFGALHWLTLLANTAHPPHLPMGPLLEITIGLMLATMILVIHLLMRFAEPGRSVAHVSPPPSAGIGNGPAQVLGPRHPVVVLMFLTAGLTILSLAVHIFEPFKNHKPSPTNLYSQPLAVVIDYASANPNEPWAWIELDSRLKAGKLSAPDAAAVIESLIQSMHAKNPDGYQGTLSWPAEFIGDAFHAKLITNAQMLRLADALYGTLPRFEPPPPRVRVPAISLEQGATKEHPLTFAQVQNALADSRLNLSVSFGNLWAQDFPIQQLNRLHEIRLDGSPIQPEGPGTPIGLPLWANSIHGPFTVGTHTIEIDFDTLLIDHANTLGIDDKTSAKDWPAGLRRWKRTVRGTFTVYPQGVPILKSVTDPTLDPTAGITVDPIIVRPHGSGKQLFAAIKVANSIRVPLSFDVSIKLDNQKPVRVDYFTWFPAENGSIAGGMQNQAEVASIPDNLGQADVVLTPNPVYLERDSRVNEVWGREVVIHGVQLRRFDLERPADSQPPTTQPTAPN